MAQTARPTDSGLPRREPGQTMEVVEHQHPGDDRPHRHRMGQIPHDHDDDGRPVVNADAKFVGPRHPSTALEDGHEWREDITTELDAAAPPAQAEDDPDDIDRRLAIGGNEQAMDRLAATSVRPDPSDQLLAAGMGILVPANDPGFAITLADERARISVVAQCLGRMFQASADSQLVNDDDLRTIYRKIRQMAATHALDLSESGDGA